MSEPDLLRVRATINLPNGLRADDVVLVDPENGYVQALLESQLLVPDVDDEPQAEPS